MLLGTVPLLVLSGRKNAEIVCVVVCERRVNKRVWLCFGIKQKVAVCLGKQKDRRIARRLLTRANHKGVLAKSLFRAYCLSN